MSRHDRSARPPAPAIAPASARREKKGDLRRLPCGSTVYVWMTGNGESHREITSKGYKFLRPGIETTFYQARCVEVIDPFGNCIRFHERLKQDGAS